ncbi:MAG: YmdB family metallophosphoesterase [Spirochaetaceae bacterium]|jgi:calcineurin-like phosphoesterase|nr:YmdB family metallophosphoesterase [Spirochaetaceae bacterium]
MAVLKVIMLGDVVGEPGLSALEKQLPALREEYQAALITVNGENAAGGFGMTETELRRILAAGADAVSSGNHIWEKRDFWPVLESETRVVRPANYPEGNPGRGWTKIEAQGAVFILVNIQGREFMPHTDCPFRTMDRLLALDEFGAALPSPNVRDSSPDARDASPDSPPAAPVSEQAANSEPESTKPEGRKPFILVDFHAEAAQEKEALAFYLDGRVSLLAGTHTHVQTADERVLPKGTGYITDLGMTGPGGSIIGMDKKICLDRSRTQILYRMECADGGGTIQGIAAELDSRSGRALSIIRINRPNTPFPL